MPTKHTALPHFLKVSVTSKGNKSFWSFHQLQHRDRNMTGRQRIPSNPTRLYRPVGKLLDLSSNKPGSRSWLFQKPNVVVEAKDSSHEVRSKITTSLCEGRTVWTCLQRVGDRLHVASCLLHCSRLVSHSRKEGKQHMGTWFYSSKCIESQGPYLTVNVERNGKCKK